jgi:hypothetical protein
MNRRATTVCPTAAALATTVKIIVTLVEHFLSAATYSYIVKNIPVPTLSPHYLRNVL